MSAAIMTTPERRMADKVFYDPGPAETLSYDCALNLPPELIIELMRHLHEHDIMSFSLTCKAFYKLCRPQDPCLCRDETHRFLLALERDHPTRRYCCECSQLHTWPHRTIGNELGPLASKSSTSKHPDGCLLGHETSFFRWGGLDFRSEAQLCEAHPCHLGFHQARSIMTAHLYGPERGTPAAAMARSGPFPGLHGWDLASSDDVDASYSRSFRVVRNELLLKADFTVRQSLGSENLLCDWMGYSDMTICPHLYFDLKEAANFRWSTGEIAFHMPELVPTGRWPRAALRRLDGNQPHTSCPICFTDYTVRVTDEEWTPGPAHGASGKAETVRGPVVRITAYHNLGNVSAPWEWKWALATNTAFVAEPRIRRCEKGAVGRLWRECEPGQARPEKPVKARWAAKIERVKAVIERQDDIWEREGRELVKGPKGTEMYVDDSSAPIEEPGSVAPRWEDEFWDSL